MRKSKSKRVSYRKFQRGGDGNHNVQSVGMPIQYFGGKLDRYFPAGSEQLVPESGAYGNTVSRSFGTYDNALTCGAAKATAPNLAPYPSSGMQTGGKHKIKKSKKNKTKSKIVNKKKKFGKQRGGDGNHNVQSVGMPIQYFGGKLDRYFPAGSKQLVPESGAYGNTVARSFGTYDNALTCGAARATAPNLAPYPSSGMQTGGKRKIKKSKKNKVRKQRGGDGNHNVQSVGMPIQYFGGKLDRYFPSGSEQLIPESGAYGNTVARSFGTYDNALTCGAESATAPNLAPYPSSGMQTGGKRKNKRK